MNKNAHNFPLHCKKYPQSSHSMCTDLKGKAGDALPCWVPLPSLQATLRRLLRVLSQLNGAMELNPDISGSVRRAGRYRGIFEFTVAAAPRGQTCKCTKKSDPVFTGSLFSCLGITRATRQQRNRRHRSGCSCNTPMKIETYFNANTHLSNFSLKGGGIVKWCTLYCPLVLSEQQ